MNIKDDLVKYLSERLDTDDQEHIEIINHLADGIVQIFYDYNIPLIANAVYKVIVTLVEKRGVRNETIIAKQAEDTKAQPEVHEFADWHSRHPGEYDES